MDELGMLWNRTPDRLTYSDYRVDVPARQFTHENRPSHGHLIRRLIARPRACQPAPDYATYLQAHQHRMRRRAGSHGKRLRLTQLDLNELRHRATMSTTPITSKLVV
ncbi:hypothetical protein GCM10023317_93460 [Actinopolymorpha pittospori]